MDRPTPLCLGLAPFLEDKVALLSIHVYKLFSCCEPSNLPFVIVSSLQIRKAFYRPSNKKSITGIDSNETPENASLKRKRYICLKHNSDEKENFLLKNYDQMGLPELKMFYTNEELNQRWLKRIIDALVAKGYVFKLDRIDAYGYFVQA